MKTSARNMLKGKGKQIKPGVVNTEVIIELPGGSEIVSIITKESADRLGYWQGGVCDHQGLQRNDRY